MGGPMGLSLVVAAIATALIVLLGLPLALLLARSRFPGRDLLASLLALPMVLPPTVLGFGLLQLVGRRGPIGWALEHWLGVSVAFHPAGAVLAASVAAFPMFLLPARSALEGVDPGLEDVARLLGRGELSVFFSVTLPIAWRGLLAGLLLAFTRALGDFGATLMLAG
ncbi:MAG: ABC transporter permease subunit, partial [Isosphaeraceae bacterium]